jgi:hypothetical protein
MAAGALTLVPALPRTPSVPKSFTENPYEKISGILPKNRLTPSQEGSINKNLIIFSIKFATNSRQNGQLSIHIHI